MEDVQEKIDQTNSIQLSLKIIVCICASLSIPNLLLIMGMMVVHNCGKMKQDVLYSQPQFQCKNFKEARILQQCAQMDVIRARQEVLAKNILIHQQTL